MKQVLLLAAALAASLAAAVPVTAQTAPPPAPGPTDQANPIPAAPTANPAATPAPPPSSIPTLPPTPSPVPSPPPSAVPSPSPSASPGGRRRHHGSETSSGPSPSPGPSVTPSPPPLATLDGDWELVEQTGSEDVYSRLELRQTGTTIAGTWKVDKVTYPIEGTFANNRITFTVQRDGRTWRMSGFVENATDMVGLIDDGKTATKSAFSASHRKAQKPDLLFKPG